MATNTLKIDDVKKRVFFANSQLAEGLTHFQTLTKTNFGDAKTGDLFIPGSVNFETDADGNVEAPEGFGLLIQPTMERVQGEARRIIAFIGAFVPTLEQIGANEKGRKWLEDTIYETTGRKLKMSYSAAMEKGQKPKYPVSLDQFIESAQRQAIMAAFNKVAAEMIAALSAKGFTIPQEFLRSALMSTKFASSNYPAKINWEAISLSMEKRAQALGYDPQIYATWRASRDTTDIVNVQADLDLGDLILGDN